MVDPAFRDDCEDWSGYSPCAVQRKHAFDDCEPCVDFTPGRPGPTATTRPYHPAMLDREERIGILEAGGLGSVLLTTAVSRAIRLRNPGATVIWFTHARGVELLQHVPGVHAVSLSSPDAPTMMQSLDVLLNFESSVEHAPLVSQASCVGGFRLNRYGKFVGVFPWAKELQRFQIDNRFRARNLKTLRQITMESVGLLETGAYDLQLSNADTQRARQLLSGLFSQKTRRRIGMNIGTSGKGRNKAWALDSYVEVASRLTQLPDAPDVLLLYGPEEREVLPRLRQLIGDNPKVQLLPDVLGVGDAMATISQLDLLVTADTFALHAALASRVPTVVLAGPMPVRELSLTPVDKVLGPHCDIAPCYLRCPKQVEGECMDRITVEVVMSEVLAALPSSRFSPARSLEFGGR